MKIEHLEVYNFDGALRGMRNPLESHDKSDSYWNYKLLNDTDLYPIKAYIIGTRDMSLAQKLIKAGTDHRKFLRQILVSMDVTASMSFWWDIDTYKVATEKNSTSRMHKIGTRYLTEKDFEWNYLTDFRKGLLEHLNTLIDKMDEAKENQDKEKFNIFFEEIIMDLPQGFKFKRTWTGNYEVLRNIYFARKNHKQREIREFCKEIEQFPYAKELICLEVN